MGESRARRRRTAGSLAFVVLVTCLVTGLFVPAARASCVGPMLGIGAAGSSPSPSSAGVATGAPVIELAAGERIVVTGQFFSSCEDVVSCTVGCSSCSAPVPTPYQGVELVLAFAGTFVSLGTVDASNEEGGDQRPGVIMWDVEIPQAVPGSGPATLEARLHPDEATASTVASLPVTVR